MNGDKVNSKKVYYNLLQQMMNNKHNNFQQENYCYKNSIFIVYIESKTLNQVYFVNNERRSIIT